MIDTSCGWIVGLLEGRIVNLLGSWLPVCLLERDSMVAFCGFLVLVSVVPCLLWQDSMVAMVAHRVLLWQDSMVAIVAHRVLLWQDSIIIVSVVACMSEYSLTM